MKIAITSVLLLLASDASAFGAFGGAKKPAGTQVVSKKGGKEPVAAKLVKNKKSPLGKKAEEKPAKKGKAEKPGKNAKKEVKAVKKAAPKKKAVAKKAAPVKKVAVKAAPARKLTYPGDDLKVEDMAGILPPVGLFDPLGFGAKADANLLRKYREAELTHGRIAMIATLGFFTGEAVAGITPLFDGPKGAGITQIAQVPAGFWITLAVTTFAVETFRVQRMIYDPVTSPPELRNRYNPEYIPGDLGFDPFGLKPSDPAEFKIKQTKELQNGRLAMLASSGFLAQELSNKKGIVENIIGDIKLEDLPFQLPALPELPF